MGKKVISKIFAPHSPKQKLVMEFLLGKGPPFTLWVACGTKWGKTSASSGGLCAAVPKTRRSLWRSVAPIYRQTKIAWNYIDRIWPGAPYVQKKLTAMEMYLPGTENTLQFWHGQSPEDLEGEAVRGQLNDECAKMKEQVLISSETTRTQTGGRFLNISTPRGKNHFYRGCMRAKEEMERAEFEGRIPNEIFITAPTSDNPHIPHHRLVEAKRLLPTRLFDQYWNALFLDEGSVWPKYLIDTETWKEPYQKDGPVEYWIHPDAKNISIVAGCDWAKKQDYTVLTCWDYSQRPYRCVGFLRFHRRPYPNQVVSVVKFLNRFKDIQILLHDKTGVGEAIDDMLDAVPGLVYRGVIFSNASKSIMVNDAVVLAERQEILFPNWPTMKQEFEDFEVEVTELGLAKYAAPSGQHDDTVFSACLGLKACEENIDRDFEATFLEELATSTQQKSHLDEFIEDYLDIDLDEGF